MKKVTSIILSFILLLSLVPYALAASFKDVSTSYTFYKEVTYLTEKGIISGFSDNTFRPGTAVTRAQAAMMIGRALGLDGTKKDTKFSDVGKDSVASGYIQSAVNEGIIQGFTDGTFRPGQYVTRGQLAIFLTRAFDLQETTTVKFKDVSSSSAAYPYIGKLLAAGITTGYSDNTFRPNQAVTRGQFSAFMARTLDPKFIPGNHTNLGRLDVSFLNVGQGDAILIEFANGKTMLVDAGRSDSAVKRELDALGVTEIDTFVATHPDADHIGGADYVIENYNVKTVIDSGLDHTTQVYIDYLEAVDATNATFKIASIGQDITLDKSVSVKVLYVNSNSSDLNDGSIVLMVSHGDIDYLLTGDAGVEVEEQLIQKYNLDAEVLKVGHHGSDTSTSQAFINEVDPLIAILSYGEGNSYGHPHSSVVDSLIKANVDVYETVNGAVETWSDGQNVYVDEEQVIIPNPTPTPTPTPEPTPQKISIISKDLAGEIVGIKNYGTTSVDMTGWKLVSVEGPQTYHFPSGYTLGAGATVYITSGSNAKNNPPTYLKWSNANIWLNSGDAAELYDASGKKVSRVN